MCARAGGEGGVDITYIVLQFKYIFGPLVVTELYGAKCQGPSAQCQVRPLIQWCTMGWE